MIAAIPTALAIASVAFQKKLNKIGLGPGEDVVDSKASKSPDNTVNKDGRLANIVNLSKAPNTKAA